MNLYSKIIMPIMALILTILAFKGKDVWQLGLFFSTFLVLLNLEQIKIFKLGKDGLELERITQEAKEKIEELKNLAISVYKPISKAISRMVFWENRLGTLELFEFKEDTEKVLSSLNIDKLFIEERIWLICNYILRDIIEKAISDAYEEANKNCAAIKKEYLQNYRRKDFNPDIDAIEKVIADAELLDEKAKQILDEARYFQKHKDIKTPSLFEKEED